MGKVQNVVYSFSDTLYLVGTAVFFFSLALFFGFIETQVVMPISHDVGYIGSIVLMFAGTSFAFWTYKSQPVTFFGVPQLVVTFLFFGILIFHYFEGGSNPLISGTVGVTSGVVWWFFAVSKTRTG